MGLELGRLKGERVILSWAGVTVTVTVKRSKGHKVILDFEAPPQVKITRGELLDRDRQGTPGGPG